MQALKAPEYAYSSEVSLAVPTSLCDEQCSASANGGQHRRMCVQQLLVTSEPNTPLV